MSYCICFCTTNIVVSGAIASAGPFGDARTHSVASGHRPANFWPSRPDPVSACKPSSLAVEQHLLVVAVGSCSCCCCWLLPTVKLEWATTSAVAFVDAVAAAAAAAAVAAAAEGEPVSVAMLEALGSVAPRVAKASLPRHAIACEGVRLRRPLRKPRALCRPTL